MSKLVLLRHGQSVWNREHRFTGWSNVELTRDGVTESERAGEILTEAGHHFDVCFTSVLKRGIDAAAATLNTMPDCSPQIERSWRLNERHFGALQDMSRWQAVRRYGPLRVRRWRRSYAVPPPPLEEDDPRALAHNARYAGLSDEPLPRSESFADTRARVAPYWEDTILRHLKSDETVLVVAHKNSLRVLAQQIEDLADDLVPRLRLPTAHPLIFEFDRDLNRIGRSPIAEKRKFNFWGRLSPA